MTHPTLEKRTILNGIRVVGGGCEIERTTQNVVI